VSDNIGIIGYSGHAFVVIEAAKESHMPIFGYCEIKEQEFNPYDLEYLGNEKDLNFPWSKYRKFILGIGDNRIRKDIVSNLTGKAQFVNIYHPSAQISNTARLGEGTFINAMVSINALANIGRHCIINTGSIVEHECVIADYVHIGPGAVLAGNVSVGTGTFIGANSTIKQGIKIGENVIIGAGAVVIRDIPDSVTVVGNPSKILK